MLVMTIQAVVFDIGGVLEITPDLGVTGMWESRLGLGPGELDKRMYDVWRGGSIGTVSERDVHQAVSEILGLDERQLAEFMADIWREYLGTANTELIEYARRLRPRYRTGILSNSFVGAREREQAAYGFEDLVDEIIYSHECGMSKPDPGIYALACERLRVEAGADGVPRRLRAVCRRSTPGGYPRGAVPRQRPGRQRHRGPARRDRLQLARSGGAAKPDPWHPGLRVTRASRCRQARSGSRWSLT